MLWSLWHADGHWHTSTGSASLFLLTVPAFLLLYTRPLGGGPSSQKMFGLGFTTNFNTKRALGNQNHFSLFDVWYWLNEAPQSATLLPRLPTPSAEWPELKRASPLHFYSTMEGALNVPSKRSEKTAPLVATILYACISTRDFARKQVVDQEQTLVISGPLLNPIRI